MTTKVDGNLSAFYEIGTRRWQKNHGQSKIMKILSLKKAKTNIQVVIGKIKINYLCTRKLTLMLLLKRFKCSRLTSSVIISGTTENKMTRYI